MVIHHLKTWPGFFQAVRDGRKQFEVRKDDRGFQIGDRLHLQEWDPDTQEYTGRSHIMTVTYRLPGPGFGIEDGFVVLGLAP